MTDSPKEPDKPNPPVVGKVTHHSIELYWDDPGRKQAVNGERLKYCVQEEEMNKTRGFGNVYNGYSQSCVCQGLEPNSQYRYRLRAINEHGPSEWSATVTVSTTRKPLTGEDLHKAVFAWDLDGVKRVLDSK
jgi:hypothetical protein